MPVSGSRFGERGQTLPFWLVAVFLSLSLTYFSFNYANSVRWQIRAQNAADSAATAVLAQDASAANSLTTLTYALSIENERDRSVNNDVLGLFSNIGGNAQCLQVLAPSCLTNYTTLAQDMTTDTNNYQALVTQVNGFSGQLTDIVGSSASANALLNNTLFGSGGAQGGPGCIKLNTDCGFHYTTKISLAQGLSGQIIADVYACRAVPTAGGGLIGPAGIIGPVATKSGIFYAIGHSRMTLAPASNGPTNPGAQINPLTGTVDQPLEPIDPNFTASENFTNFSSININANYLVPKPAPPDTSTPQTVAALCPGAGS